MPTGSWQKAEVLIAAILTAATIALMFRQTSIMQQQTLILAGEARPFERIRDYDHDSKQFHFDILNTAIEVDGIEDHHFLVVQHADTPCAKIDASPDVINQQYVFKIIVPKDTALVAPDRQRIFVDWSILPLYQNEKISDGKSCIELISDFNWVINYNMATYETSRSYSKMVKLDPPARPRIIYGSFDPDVAGWIDHYGERTDCHILLEEDFDAADISLEVGCLQTESLSSRSSSAS